MSRRDVELALIACDNQRAALIDGIDSLNQGLAALKIKRKLLQNKLRVANKEKEEVLEQKRVLEQNISVCKQDVIRTELQTEELTSDLCKLNDTDADLNLQHDRIVQQIASSSNARKQMELQKKRVEDALKHATGIQKREALEQERRDLYRLAEMQRNQLGDLKNSLQMTVNSINALKIEFKGLKEAKRQSFALKLHLEQAQKSLLQKLPAIEEQENITSLAPETIQNELNQLNAGEAALLSQIDISKRDLSAKNKIKERISEQLRNFDWTEVPDEENAADEEIEEKQQPQSVSALVRCKKGGPHVTGILTVSTNMLMFEDGSSDKNTLCVDMEELLECQLIREKVASSTTSIQLKFSVNFQNRFLLEEQSSHWSSIVTFSTQNKQEITSLLQTLLRLKRSHSAGSFLAVEQPNISINLLSNSDLCSKEQLAELVSFVPKRLQFGAWHLLYSTTRHGTALSRFYNNVRDVAGTIILIQDSRAKLFGGFSSDKWTISKEYYGSGECFVFTFNPKLIVYNWSGANNLCMLSDKNFIAFGGGGNFAIYLDNELWNGSSGPCDTFSSPCLSSSQDFSCQSMEVWGCQ